MDIDGAFDRGGQPFLTLLCVGPKRDPQHSLDTDVGRAITGVARGRITSGKAVIMSLHRSMGAGTLALVLAFPGATVMAQSTAPSTSPAPPCGLADLGHFRLRVGPGEVLHGRGLHWQTEDPEPFPLDSIRDPGAAEGKDVLDLVAGTDLRVEAFESELSDMGGPRSIPVESVVATLDIEGAPPIWLPVSRAPDGTASIRLPAILATELQMPPVTGDGVLAVRVGVCDGWSQAAYSNVTVADPAAIADCPIRVEDVLPYANDLDTRVRVGASTVPEREIHGAIGRYTDSPAPDEGDYGGIAYHPASPPVRVRPDKELHVRPVDRDMDLVDAWVEWADRPPTSELRDGFVTSLFGRKQDAETRPDGNGGYYVRAPRTPGRYMLLDRSRWQDHCIKVTSNPMPVIVEIR